MIKKNYKYVDLHLKKRNTELLEEINEIATNKFSCDGVEEFSLDESEVDKLLGDRAYSGGDIPESVLDEVDERVQSHPTLSYRYFFYNDNYSKNATEFCSFLNENKDNFLLDFKLFNRPWEDWNTKWREHFNVIKISENINIIPEWKKNEYLKSDPKNIYIYPGMGFGTGEHATTNLCLKLFDKVKDQCKDEELCLDFGCGSGILGIAAIKFSNLVVDFCDIDTNALDNTVQNLELNFKNKNISLNRLVSRERFNESDKKYKLVFANILEHILIKEKKLLIESVRSDGYLIVSGLLNHQVQNIIDNYSDIFVPEETISEGDWSAIRFRVIS